MRLLRLLFFPFTLLGRLALWPFRLRTRRNILKKHGWVELHLEGEVTELRPPQTFQQQLIRKFMKREEAPRVVLSRLRRFARELASDPHARGVLVRLGLLECGWAEAEEIHRALLHIRDAGKQVLVHVVTHAGNKETFIGAAGTRFLLTPVGAFAAVGTAASGVFLGKTLERAGVKVEVASRGRFKSAPDQLTRTDRNEHDLEQVKALVDAFDEALVEALASGRGLPKEEAIALVDRAPLVAQHALEARACDGLARDEDLPEEIRRLAEAEKVPELLGASAYLDARHVLPPLRPRAKRVGIVEVHGPIVDKAPPYGPVSERAAVERAVVADLREALADPDIGAVVLWINSRGGSVTASDGIWSAVKRLDREKPVVACLGDVAASGGYYIACGARAIVCSPLTITGSIGVFAMLPTWPKLGEMLEVGHDVVKNRQHAALYNPWTGLEPEAKAHADREVGAMYAAFTQLVADCRGLGLEQVHAAAEGRVWTGRDAARRGLVDGLEGMEEAIRRAKEEAGGRFAEEPVLVTAKHPHRRPPPFEPGEKRARSSLSEASLHGEALGRGALARSELIALLAAQFPDARLASELLTLAACNHPLRLWAWSPLDVG